MRGQRDIEQRRRFWAELERSDDPIRVVAKRVGIPESTAYAWKKAGPIDEPTFARLVPTQPETAAALKLQAGGATIVVEQGFDAELLRAVVGALGGEP